MRKILNAILTALITIFIFLTASCEKKRDAISVKAISVADAIGNYNILNLSDFAKEIEYIPLETNNTVLVSTVILQIISENDKILILDVTSANKNNCYLFDNKGNFFCKIGQHGQGPDDYLQIDNVSVHDNFIFLMARHKILIYDFNGHLVENINLQSNEIPLEYRESAMRRIIPLKKDHFVANVITRIGYYPTAFLFETYQSKIVKINEYPSSVILDKMRPGYGGDELGTIYRYNDVVRIYKPTNDTVFTIGKNKEMKDVFFFELGKYKPTLAYFEFKVGGSDVMQMATQHKNLRKTFIFPRTIHESRNHLFISFDFGNYAPELFTFITHTGSQGTNPFVYSVFNKYTGVLTLMRQPIREILGFNNDIDNGPVIWPHYISSKDELVTYISVEEFLGYYDKIEKPTPQMAEIAKKVKFDDNQIVIIAKLKE